jgi:hypothetical protein
MREESTENHKTSAEATKKKDTISKHIKTSAKKKTLQIVKVSAMFKQTGI